jgi:hypothetical protein
MCLIQQCEAAWLAQAVLCVCANLGPSCSLLIEEGSTMLRARQVLLTAACLLSSLLLAMAFPTQAEKMFAGERRRVACAWLDARVHASAVMGAA